MLRCGHQGHVQFDLGNGQFHARQEHALGKDRIDDYSQGLEWIARAFDDLLPRFIAQPEGKFRAVGIDHPARADAPKLFELPRPLVPVVDAQPRDSHRDVEGKLHPLPFARGNAPPGPGRGRIPVHQVARGILKPQVHLEAGHPDVHVQRPRRPAPRQDGRHDQAQDDKTKTTHADSSITSPRNPSPTKSPSPTPATAPSPSPGAVLSANQDQRRLFPEPARIHAFESGRPRTFWRLSPQHSRPRGDESHRGKRSGRAAPETGRTKDIKKGSPSGLPMYHRRCLSTNSGNDPA